MRELGFFLASLALALSFWAWKQSRDDADRGDAARRLVALGSYDEQTSEAERLLLTGDFAEGLRATPSAQAYDRLAPLFLVGHDLDSAKGKVRTHAHTASVMSRVLGERLQFFDVEGDPISPTLWRLGSTLEPGEDSLLTSAGEASLEIEGEWILSRMGKRHGAFRRGAQGLVGFLADRPVTVEGDSVTVDGTEAWKWDGQSLLVRSTP